MKGILLKHFFVCSLFFVSASGILHAQNVGGTNSNQSAPREVKASELSKGAYTSDVNLFTGTMATSYDLGTVSTLSGLSYNLQLNYSTAKTVGNNPGILKGLSYGDGWNINIPTISVTVEAYRNIVGATNINGNCTLLSIDNARAEGKLAWFAPYINIPGVVSERFILKTIDTLRNEMVFVPNIMEKYIEARLSSDGQSWKVINHNGDVYSFGTGAMTNYKAAPQLNYVEDNFKNSVGLREDNLVPREEPITWYCDIIYNKNHPLNQQIAFQYQVFGQFDFYKEFMQPTLNQSLGMKVGNQLGFSSFKVNRDILLVGIESYSDRGSIEKLELDYKTILPPNNARNLLSISDPSVKRLDSLNNYRIVFSHGVDNPLDSASIHSYGFNSGLNFNFGLNQPSPGFVNLNSSSWRRYMHIMSSDATPYRNPLFQLGNAFKNPSNPYLSNDPSFVNGSYIFSPISSSTGNSELKFKHGFLETPRILNDIVPGDIYEVKSLIKNYNVTNLKLQICNFDISVVSGSGTEYTINGSKLDGTDFLSGTRGYQVFNTFNNPVKWSSLAHNIVGSQQTPNTYNGQIATSNFFLMPTLPKDFNGINIQIGPSNSDHDYALDLQTSDAFHLTLFPQGTSHPSAYFANKYLQKQSNNGGNYFLDCLESPYSKPSHNFGIGLPWFMMNEVYTDMSNDLSTDHLNDNYRFWWRDALSGNNSTGPGVDPFYPNVPTAADENVALAAFEVIRYSKNPYMLYRVKKFKYNGLNYSDTLPKNKYLVNQLNLGYSFKVDSLFSYKYSQQNVLITQDTIVNCTTHFISSGNTINIKKLLSRDFLGFQNVYLLSEVKQIPVNGAMANAPSSYVEANLPTTHFYYSKMETSDFVKKATHYTFTGNIHVISKIVDQLGGVMVYDYYPIHDGLHTRFVETTPNNNYGLLLPNDPYKLPEERTFKLQIVVKEKKYFNSQTAVFPTKTWQYEYLDGSLSGFCHDGTPYYGKNKTAHTGTHYFHDSYDADFGFITTIVKYPQLNSTTIVPYDKYTHFNNENQNLTFGKLKKVEKFDASGQLLNKKEYEYKTTNAYGNFLFTANRVVSNHFNDNHLEYTYDYNTTAPNFALNFSFVVSHFASKCNMSFSGRSIPFLEMNNMKLFQDNNSYTYPNSYFVRLVKETNTDYDYTNVRGGAVELVSSPLFRGINLGDVTNVGQEIDALSGVNTLKLETSRMISADPSLIMRQAIPFQTRNELTTITEYEYWDADSMGISYSDGFEYLLNETYQMQGSQALKFEPSFELFRTKTYSPQLFGAYTITENYYYYDVKQDVTRLNQYNTYNTPQYFDALNYSHMYGIRNLMYQKTVISKAANQSPVSKSEYYWYDTRTLTDTVFYYDTLYIDFDFCNGGNTSGGTTGDSGGSTWVPDPPAPDPIALGCYQVPHPFEPPQPGFTFTEVTPGEWWYCPSGTGSSTQRTGGSSARYLNIPSDMKTKLTLRRIDEQIDTIKVDLTTYYHKYHPVLRFKELYRANYPGGPLNVPMNEYGWYLPYKTKTKYKTLEHTIFGQVRLDMNERGLKTRYNYQTVFSTTFIDNVSNCPTNPGGAYNLTDQGVPKCITVGSGLPDSLTTCYTYNKDYTINSITDPNGMVLSYEYDNFSRMNSAFRNGQLLSFNQYSQWMNDTTLTFEQRADQNYVESYILLNNGSTVAEHSRAYIDPLGRKYDVLTQVTPNYTNPLLFDTLMIHSGLTTYDNWDRVEKQYKPFKQINGGSAVPFSPLFNPTANFTEQQYENNQRGRVLRASKFGENINTGHTVNSSYQIITGIQLQAEITASLGNPNIYEITGTTQNQLPFQRFLKTSSIDEDSKKTVSYTNAIGQKVATKTYANGTSQEVTGFVYNSQGLLKKVINPKLQNTTYEYNLSGNMYRKVSVDADTVKYLYDVSGNVVLEQDANGKHGRDEANNTLYMRKYTYDIFGRMIEQDRVHYNTTYDPLRYQPFVHGYFSNLSDTNKVFYQFSNTATLDFYGGWIVEKCNTGGLIYRQTQPTGGTTGPINPFDPGFNPDPNGPNNPPANPCSMVYGNVNDSLRLSAPEKKWAYHFQVDGADPEIASNTLSSVGLQNYLKGRLGMAKSYSHDGTFSNLKIYSYNSVGLMEKEVTQFNNITNSNIYTSIINYPAYNLRNSLVEQTIDTDADGVAEMSYNYGYDGWNRLRMMSVKQGSNSYRTLASYNYDDALGLITKTKYYDLYSTCNLPIDSINYRYDTRNRLKLLASTLYNERLLYDGVVPITQQPAFGVASSRNYNGNINGLFHTYKLNTTTNYVATGGIMDSSTVYGYKYDGLNRLINADASVLNVLKLSDGLSVYTAKKKYGDESIAYDAVGNIVSLNRGLYYNPSIPTPANAMQNWNYTYQVNNNQLIHVDSINGTPLRQYNFDNNGNQNSDLVNNELSTVSYMRSNLPNSISIDHDITTNGDNTNVNYDYNANDDRLYKKVSIFRDLKETYYLRDASGKEIAEYDITNNNWVYYAYGRDRIADFNGTTLSYYINDHLGSVRLTYSAQGNCHNLPINYTIESANDYYAFGKVLRSFNGGNKYGHQGSERENELSENDYYTHFRGLDDDIARWKQVDPKMELQYNWSPYVSMNNNPVSNTDVLGDRIHANLRTWAEIWRQGRADPVFRAEIRRQMSDVRTSRTRMANGRWHTETSKQHYHYNINRNSNTTIQQAVFTNQARSAQDNANNTPASANHYPLQSFNTNKTENIRAIGQGNEATEKNTTDAKTIVSDNSYQNGTVNLTFTPNVKDPNGADRIQIFQGQTIIYNQIISNNPSDPAGYNNISVPFNGVRDHIKIKITDSDDRRSSSPGAFDLKGTISGF